MVKNLNILLLVSLVSLTGCADKNVEAVNAQKEIVKTKSHNISNEDERRIMYKGDYNIQYKEPRVVWFKPMLTNKGNILSERTIALAPKDLRWSNEEEKTLVGSKFKELIKD